VRRIYNPVTRKYYILRHRKTSKERKKQVGNLWKEDEKKRRAVKITCHSTDCKYNQGETCMLDEITIGEEYDDYWLSCSAKCYSFELKLSNEEGED